MKSSEGVISQTSQPTVLQCKSQCENDAGKCKLYNWNQRSQNCFTRAFIPGGIGVFTQVAEAIVGVPNCKNIAIIWPEIFPAIVSTITTATTTTTTTNFTTTATTTTTTVSTKPSKTTTTTETAASSQLEE